MDFGKTIAEVEERQGSITGNLENTKKLLSNANEAFANNLDKIKTEVTAVEARVQALGPKAK